MKKKYFIGILVIAALFMASFANTVNAQKSNDDPIKILKSKKCTSCHSVKILKVKRKNKKSKAPDLSNVGAEHEPSFFVNWLLKKSKMNGKRHPIKFNGTEDEFASLLGLLMTLRETKEE